MTIAEAVAAARANAPVVREDVLLGPILYGRIGAIRKEFSRLAAVDRGQEAEVYTLELLPISSGRSVTITDPALVRLATAEELKDVRQYPRMPQPAPREELIDPEVRARR